MTGSCYSRVPLDHKRCCSCTLVDLEGCCDMELAALLYFRLYEIRLCGIKHHNGIGLQHGTHIREEFAVDAGQTLAAAVARNLGHVGDDLIKQILMLEGEEITMDQIDGHPGAADIGMCLAERVGGDIQAVHAANAVRRACFCALS